MLQHAQFHGATRLAETRHRWPWALALFLLAWSSAGVLKEVLVRFYESPTMLVKLNSNRDYVAFPCVIVCPEINFPTAKIDAFLKQVEYPVDLNETVLKPIIKQVAAYFAPDVRYYLEDLELIQTLLDYNNISIEAAVKRMMTSCDETFIRCSWRSNIVNCSSLFTMELSGDGFCCVFNGRSLKREIEEVGLRNIKVTRRRYTNYVGYLYGVSMAIDQSQELNNIDISYKWASKCNIGLCIVFQLALQGGNGYVDVSLNGSALSKGEEAWYGFYQSRLQLSSEAKAWGTNLLRCRFQDERLQYFPLYTWRYCLLECEISRTLKKCGCVRPNHPRPAGIQPCPAHKMECFRQSLLATSSMDECNCPQSCDMESDYIRVQTFKLVQDQLSYDPIYEGLNLENVTIVRAFVLNHYSPTFKRRPIQTSLDLFSNLGGVFNVYLGISVLTTVELIILLMKYCLNCRVRKKRKVKINPIVKIN